MKMLIFMALLPSLATGVPAQDSSWKGLSVGDRIEVTLLNGATICGTIVEPRSKSPTVDIGAESAVTLDVSVEVPGLDGTMTFAKRDLRGFRRLRVHVGTGVPGELKAPPPASLKIEAPKPAAKEATGPTPEDAPVPPAAPAGTDTEDLKKAIEFYAAFPPPYWGPERHTMDVQKRARGQALSPAERDFEAGYPTLWEKGRAAAKSD
ncbi:MAG TPA: hypothetical protein VKW04_02895 [Planctomycetota bacterium]|nr:hypothetical protein [Planctomycetota bacterium]